VRAEIPGDRRDVALPPAPLVYERLIDGNKPDRYRRNSNDNGELCESIRDWAHDSRLDKWAR
jgi:hypothetical protein